MAEKKATEHTAIRNTISTTDKEAQYDKEAKEIMGNKYILAYLLVHTVEEFHGMDPVEAAAYIEGDPYVGIVPVEPGMTNACKGKKKKRKKGTRKSNGAQSRTQNTGEKIIGLNKENAEKNEGVIYFDILFFARTRDGKSKIIIDVEIQKDEPTGYHILDRAVFYVSRQISSQKGREFVKSKYNDIKQVYSIWICLNQKTNALKHICFEEKDLDGKKVWKGRKEIPNIIMLSLSRKLTEQKEKKKLYRLLGTLFSDKLEAEEKIKILETEYQIPMEEKLEEGLKYMCNLSQGIKEEGIRLGKQRGIAIGEQRGMQHGENLMAQLFDRLMSAGRNDDCQRVIRDKAYRKRMMKELNIQ